MSNQPLPQSFSTQSIDAVLERLDSSKEAGLDDKQVDERLKTYGHNVLPDSDPPSSWTILLNQFKSTIVYILAAAAIISLVYHHYLDFWIIVILVLLNAVLGFLQEFKAERSIEALKQLITPHITVIRAGKRLLLDSADLVPGDIMLLEEGDQVPADGRLLLVDNLQTDESALTGESNSVVKMADTLETDVPIAEQTNMVWMGSAVSTGNAQALVVTTGKHTMLGGIASGLQNIEEKQDHFKQKTDDLAKQMGIVAIGSVILIFIVGYFVRGFSFEDILMFSVASLVSAIPEGLPMILTVILALSAQRMARRNALVRRLSTTETLSVVDTIVTDKTGTLTQNKMSVTCLQLPYQPPVRVHLDGHLLKVDQADQEPTSQHFPLQKILDIAGHCHNVHVETADSGEQVFKGDPTEVVLCTLAGKLAATASYQPSAITQLDDLPFDMKIRLRATLAQYTDTQKREIFVIGSPEVVLERCQKVLMPDHQEHHLNEAHTEHIQAHLQDLASKGMRVIALAYKKTTNETVQEDDFASLVFVGLAGMIDPPRPETKTAIAAAHKAGIRVIMATGDHPLTAKAIALDLGIADAESVDRQVITEAEFNALSKIEMSARLPELRVFARMAPLAKLQLAELLQQQGHVVAMTGDGVNDAPALKQADIGLSMGKNGTDVAREASDIVLTDDNFATIMAAIEEGRTQLRNVRRTSFFYITTNLGETLTLLLFLLIGFPLPLLPKQLLWLNLVTAGVNDIALALEPAHEDALDAPPRPKGEAILNNQIKAFLLIIVGTLMLLSLGTFLAFLPQGLEKARTAIFVTLAATQLYTMFGLRSLKRSLKTIGPLSSRPALIALTVSFLLLCVVIYIPPLSRIFDFRPLSFLEMLMCLSISSLALVACEAYKAYYRNRKRPTPQPALLHAATG